MTNNTRSNTSEQHDSIDFDQVRELEPGDAIAVRAVQDQVTTVLAGEIKEIQSADLEHTLEEMRDELGESDAIAYRSHVHIDADIWWRIDGDEMKDESARLQDRPSYRPYLAQPPRDAPPCSLALGSDRSVTLVIPTPDSNGSRIISYYPGPFAPVIECVSRPIVEPTRVLPETHEPPESSSQ